MTTLFSVQHDEAACYGSRLHCCWHYVDEPDDELYAWCLECHHCYRTREDLLAAWAREMPDSGISGWAGIGAPGCAYCGHDWLRPRYLLAGNQRGLLMANHFPSPPGGSSNMLLTELTYLAEFPVLSSTISGPLAFAGTTGILGGAAAEASQWAIQYSFTTPGSAGSFDQDEAEYGLAQWLKLMTEALAGVTGASPAVAASAIAAVRVWGWVSSDGNGSESWRDTSWNWSSGITFP